MGNADESLCITMGSCADIFTECLVVDTVTWSRWNEYLVKSEDVSKRTLNSGDSGKLVSASKIFQVQAYQVC